MHAQQPVQKGLHSLSFQADESAYSRMQEYGVENRHCRCLGRTLHLGIVPELLLRGKPEVLEGSGSSTDSECFQLQLCSPFIRLSSL